MNKTAEALDLRLQDLRRRAGKLATGPSLEALGRIQRIGDDVAMVSGLPETRLNELLRLETLTRPSRIVMAAVAKPNG